MFTYIALLGLAVIPTPRVATRVTNIVRPRIEVWSNRGDAVYTRSQGVRVYFRADQDGYVTLFRVDTDGRVRVLFPRDPWEDNCVRGGREYEALGNNSRDAFYVDDYPGVGYLFAVVAADPFAYAAIESGNHWDYRTIADGRVRGDPYVALTDLAERIVPENYADWDYDITPYYVDQHYDYPRFLCYDCHAYASYTYWDPYWRSCVRFRVVVYDNPYYYPYRYYGGRRVVFVRPFRPQPRFVFKDRDGSGRDNFVTRERERPLNDDRRRTVSSGERIGTTGTVPAPRDAPRRERPGVGGGFMRDNGRSNAPDQNRDDDRRRTPDSGNQGRGNDGTTRDNGGVRDNGGTRDDGNTGNRDDGDRGRGRRVTPDQGTVPATPGREVPTERGRDRSDDRGRGNDDRGRGNESQDRGRWERPPVQRVDPPRGEPRRVEPREQPRAEPRAEPRQSRPETRAEPRQSRPEPRAEPRRESPPRAEPRGRSGGEPKPKSEGELRRRKPD